MEPDVTHLQNPEVETVDEIGIGKNEMVLRFVGDMHRGRYFYVKTDVILK